MVKKGAARDRDPQIRVPAKVPKVVGISPLGGCRRSRLGKFIVDVFDCSGGDFYEPLVISRLS